MPRFKSILPMLLLLAVAFTAWNLGQWQLQRAQQRESLQATLNQAQSTAPITVKNTLLELSSSQHRRLIARGQFVPNSTVYLDNRNLNGQAGLHVVSVFMPTGSALGILVNRGFIPRNKTARSQIAHYTTPTQEVEIQGTGFAQFERVMNLGTPSKIEAQALLQNLEISEYAQHFSLKLQPFLLRQVDSPDFANDGLQRAWPLAASGADKNRGYAFQWFALCGLSLLILLIYGYRHFFKSHRYEPK